MAPKADAGLEAVLATSDGLPALDDLAAAATRAAAGTPPTERQT